MKDITDITFDFLASLDQNQPRLFLISGADTLIATHYTSIMKDFLAQKEDANFQQTILSTDNPLQHLLSELENQPMFPENRLLLIYDGNPVLQELKGNKKKELQLGQALALQSRQLMILFAVSGKLSARMLKVFAQCTNSFHLITKPLYEKQIHQSLVQAIQAHGIRLTDDAWDALRKVHDQKKSSHLKLAERLKDYYNQRPHLGMGKQGGVAGGVEKEKEALTKDEILTIFVPEDAMNMFDFVDHLFSGNFEAAQRELNRYNVKENSFLVVLKLLLNRLNEIRKFDCAKQMAYSPEETKKLLSITHLPPFIQRRILERSQITINRMPLQKQLKLYDVLLQVQIAFRRSISQGEQIQVFRCQIVPMFFERV